MVSRSAPVAKAPSSSLPTADALPAEALRLLVWYDRHRRALPWRALPGESADPYRVWLSEIMLQQTTVASVKGYYEAFLARWPDVSALAAAADGDVMAAWAGLGYYSRARNLLACARVVAAGGGVFPAGEAALRALPGIGDYTAAAIAAIAFDRRAVVVDGNVERVIARLFAIATPLPAAKPLIKAATAGITPALRPGDFAQAMMDLGATICTPRRPACVLCPLNEGCLARQQGLAEALPARLPRAERPRRRGVAFVVRDGEGRLLVCTRPAKGLLGGMTDVPGTAWAVDAPTDDSNAPLPAAYRRAGSITHVFTHFALDLTVYAADVPSGTAAPAGARWLAPGEIAGAAFPTVFRKVLVAAGVE